MKGKITLARLLAVLFVLLALLLAAPAAVADPSVQTPGVPPKGPEWGNAAPRGVVSVADPLSARAGAEILAKGGNAIDAAAAIQFALNVEEPQLTGIGGGCFIMVYLADTKQVVMVDGREKAPGKATPQWFLDANGNPLPFNDAVASGLSVGVPGTLMATATALEKYGTMSLSEVMAPAIKMAGEGIIVPAWLANTVANTSKLRKTPGNAYSFFHADGTPIQAGELLVQKDLANTFKTIASQGIDAYYQGPIGEAVSAIVKARGAPMEVSDVKAYDTKIREPIRGTYRGWELASVAPPSSGGLTVIQTLKLLERFPLGAWGHNTTDTLSVVIEALRLAYADRGKYDGDSDFVNMPMKGMLDPAYIAARSALIDPAKADPNLTFGNPWPYDGGTPAVTAMREPGVEGGETTSFAVVDQWGNMVAQTTTIESGWGSGIMVPGYGFMLNNELTDFDFVPGGANQVDAFKRPRSSMSPTILLKDGKPWMATGSPGGATIINTVAQVIMNVIDHGMTIQEAINAPRISHTSSSYTARTSWETGISDQVRSELTARGHPFSSSPGSIGSDQSVVIDLQTGRMFGGADPRMRGTVIYVKGGANNLENSFKK